MENNMACALWLPLAFLLAPALGLRISTEPMFKQQMYWERKVTDRTVLNNSDDMVEWLHNNSVLRHRLMFDMGMKVFEVDPSTPRRVFKQRPQYSVCDHATLPMPVNGSVESEDNYHCAQDGTCRLYAVDRTIGLLYEQYKTTGIEETYDAKSVYGGCLRVWNLSETYGWGAKDVEHLRNDGNWGVNKSCVATDGSGLPVAPLLVTIDELVDDSVEIEHALRLAIPRSKFIPDLFAYPATTTSATKTRGARDNDHHLPMGAHLKLKEAVATEVLNDAHSRCGVLNKYSKKIVRAMRDYGLIVVSEGTVPLSAASDKDSDHKYFGSLGDEDPNRILHTKDLVCILFSDFEVLDWEEQGGLHNIVTLRRDLNEADEDVCQRTLETPVFRAGLPCTSIERPGDAETTIEAELGEVQLLSGWYPGIRFSILAPAGEGNITAAGIGLRRLQRTGTDAETMSEGDWEGFDVLWGWVTSEGKQGTNDSIILSANLTSLESQPSSDIVLETIEVQDNNTVKLIFFRRFNTFDQGDVLISPGDRLEVRVLSRAFPTADAEKVDLSLLVPVERTSIHLKETCSGNEPVKGGDANWTLILLLGVVAPLVLCCAVAVILVVRCMQKRKQKQQERDLNYLCENAPNAEQLEPAQIAGILASGKFIRGRLLGKGQFGSVYLAILPTGHAIAAKYLDASTFTGKDQQGYTKEISMMRELQHPNVVRYYYASFLPFTKEIVLFMEYVPGGSLAKFVRSLDEPLGEKQGSVYVKQVLKGLEYLHAQSIIHRDVKADNVLLDTGARVCKVSDFGSSKKLHDMTEGAKTLAGTPSWMAPEVIRNAGETEYTSKVDTWSVGCMTVEILNRGTPPWPEFPSQWAAMYYIADPANSPDMPESLSEECRAFCALCLRRNPQERPSCSELLQNVWLEASVDEKEEEEANEPVPNVDDAVAKMLENSRFGRNSDHTSSVSRGGNGKSESSFETAKSAQQSNNPKTSAKSSLDSSAVPSFQFNAQNAPDEADSVQLGTVQPTALDL